MSSFIRGVRLWGLVGIGLITFSGQAVAVSSSQTIKVTASVMAAKYVYINDTGQIKKIVSNSDVDAPPVVITDQIPSQQLPLTESILKQFNQLKVRYSLNQYGVVYDSQADQLLTTDVQKAAALYLF